MLGGERPRGVGLDFSALNQSLRMVVAIWGRLFLWLAVIAGSLLIVVMVVLIMNFGDRRAAETQRADRVEAAPTYHPTEVGVARLPAETHFLRAHEFTGRLVPKRETRLGFELGGQIREVLVEVGQPVEEGQVLAVLDTQLLQSQATQLGFQRERALALLAELEAGPRPTTIRAAEAELAAVTAEAGNATNLRVRQAELVAQGAVSQQEFDTVAATEQAILKRQVAAEQRLAELREGSRPEQIAAQRALVQALLSEQALVTLQIQKSSLRAPYAGVVTRQQADVGQVLAAGQPIFDLVQGDWLEAHIGVTAAVAACLLPDHAYTLRVDHDALEATLLRIVPIVDTPTQTMTAIFSVDPQAATEAGVWIPGRLVRLPWKSPMAMPGVWVPNDALARGRRGLWCVYTLDLPADQSELPPAGAAAVCQQQVEILYSSQHWSYVRGTLSAEAWVVVQGASRLLDGQWVQPAALALQRPTPWGESETESPAGEPPRWQPAALPRSQPDRSTVPAVEAPPTLSETG
jgi:multidrug efflux pump subunit AcrA (membrane-fusion protein)